MNGISCFGEEVLPVEAFAKVQELFSCVDWLDPTDDAALNVLQQVSASNIVDENLDCNFQIADVGSLLQEMSLRKSPRFMKLTIPDYDNKNSLSLAKIESVSSPKQSPTFRKSENEPIPQEMSPKKSPKKKNPAVLDSDYKNLSFTNIESVPSPSQSSDAEMSKRKTEPQNVQTVYLPPNQLMFQETSQALEPTSVSFNSPKDSLGFVIKHQIPYTIVGTKSHLLSDASFGSVEDSHSENVSPVVPCPTSSVSFELENFHVNNVSIAPSMPQPPPPMRPSLTSDATSRAPPPPPLPLDHIEALKSKESSKGKVNETYLQDKYHVSIVRPTDTTSSSLSSSTRVLSISPSTIAPTTPSPIHPTPSQTPLPPPPPPTLLLGKKNSIMVGPLPPPPPPLPPPRSGHSINHVSSSSFSPSPRPYNYENAIGNASTSPLPPPPPPSPTSSSKNSYPTLKSPLVAPPPPLAPLNKGIDGFMKSLSLCNNGKTSFGSLPSGSPLNPPNSAKVLPQTISSRNNQKKLKPLHWSKFSRAVKGSLWADTEKSGEASEYEP